MSAVRPKAPLLTVVEEPPSCNPRDIQADCKKRGKEDERLAMESNGKRVSYDRRVVKRVTEPVCRG